ncbi:DUF2125 domain-containing protein [Dongia sp.]|uniref:DUF2125 domain-containing protein n=1 Tax=Dongia sp. TaxID=1977262 RepID=UPI0035B1ECD0
MKRRFLAGSLAAVLIFGGAYTAYWHHVAGRLEAGIADWVSQQLALGNVVEVQPGDVTGFPFAFRRDVTEVTLTQPVADGLLTLRAAAGTLSMRPWNLLAVAFEAAQPIEISITSPVSADVNLAASRIGGAVRLTSDGRLERIDAQMQNLTLTDGRQSYAAATADLTIDLPPLTPRDHREKLLGFDLTLGHLQLPDGQRALTADPIAKAAAAGTIMGPIPSGLPPRVALAQWAQAGGTIELSRFAFVQVPLDLEGEGTLALDRNQQMLGALTIRAQGLTETVDLLANEGMLEPGAAKTGRMMAEGMAKTDESGRKVVSIALSLQQGYVWLGPIKLARLPVLTWQ